MKAYVFPSDEYGVGHYRMIWPSLAVASEGHMAVKVVPPRQDGGIGGWIGPGGRLEHAWAPEDADVVVMQRVTRAVTVAILRKLREQGVATVVDVDDDLTCIDPANPAFSVIHPRRDPNNNWTWLTDACREADMVTCSTRSLAERFGPHGRVAVLENRVPARLVSPPREDRGGTDPLFGWAGDIPTHPRDLYQATGPLAQTQVRFAIVGPEPPAGWAEHHRVNLEMGTGEVAFDKWVAALQALDVGLAPLADTKFNRAKSWLKPLEYAAAGVPWIGSHSPEYRRLSATVPGLIAAKPAHWTRAIRAMQDPATRAEASAAGREAVLEHHVYEGSGWRWAEAWEKAVQIRKKRHGP